jgi:hypothetical protein
LDLGLTQNITEHFNKKRNGKKKGGVVKRNTAPENKASDVRLDGDPWTF